VGSQGAPARIAVEGTTLYALYPGVTGAGGYPGQVRSWSLPSGTPGFACTLASANPTEIMVLPGQGVAYLRAGTSVVPVNLVTGTEMPTMVLGGAAGPITQWVFGGTILYCLMPGQGGPPFQPSAVPPAIGAIDTISHAVVYPAVAVPGTSGGYGNVLRYGPGPSGNALFLSTTFLPSQLLRIDPITGITTGVPVPGPVANFVLSPGGTEWLILVGGSAPSLHAMNPQTLASTPLTTLPAFSSNSIIPIPNATMRRALVLSGFNNVMPMNTDPATAPVSSLTVPLAAYGFVVD
jgi:hypothetical protein